MVTASKYGTQPFHGLSCDEPVAILVVAQVAGDLTFNGHSFDEFVVPRTAAYVDQYSSHIAELTVRETLDFAARVQGGGHGESPHRVHFWSGY